MAEGATNQWVWWSDAQSRAAGAISILAVTETLFFVVVYWLLVLWAGITWHHWVILIATPLVLMRSEASMVLGVKWFSEFWAPSKHGVAPASNQKLIVLALFGLVVGVAAASFLTKIWLVNLRGWPWIGYAALTFWIASNAGLAAATAADSVVAGSIVQSIARKVYQAGTKVVVTSAAIAVFLLPGIPLGYWLRAVITRLIATLRHPVAGIMTFPANWHRTALSADFCQPPELVPGHQSSGFGEFGQLSFSGRSGRSRPAAYVITGWLVRVIFFAPTLIWRWSIKSTAWFYLPLLWVGRGWMHLNDSELLIWGKAYCGILWNWVGLSIAGLALALTIAPLVGWSELVLWKAEMEAQGAPFSPFLAIAVVDWSALKDQPWHWFYMPSWALTLLLFFVINKVATEIRSGAAPETRLAKLRMWMWASNVRYVLTNLGLLISLAYILRAVDAWGQVKAFWTGL